MLGIAGVRTEFMEGMSYKLASEAIFLTVVPFLFGRFQSSAARVFLAATVRVIQHLIWNRERPQEHERQRMSVYVFESRTPGVAALICERGRGEKCDSRVRWGCFFTGCKTCAQIVPNGM